VRNESSLAASARRPTSQTCCARADTLVYLFIYLFICLFVQIAVGRFKNDQIAAITQLYLKETAENFTRKVGAIFGQFQRKVKSILRYDTIQDDISTCNQKLTCVSLIYSTEPTTNSGEKKTKN